MGFNSAFKGLITNKGNSFALKVLLEERRQYNLETLAHEKALDEVRRKLLYDKVLYRTETLLTAIIKTYENNEINVKLGATLTQQININKGVRQGCQISPNCYSAYDTHIATAPQHNMICYHNTSFANTK